MNESPTDGAPGKSFVFENGKTILSFDPLFFFTGIFWLSYPWRIDVGRNFDFHFRILFQVSGSGSKGAMNRTVTDPKIKGFILFLSVSTPYVFLSPLGIVVSGVALSHYGFLSIGLDELFFKIISGIFRECGAIPNFLKIPVASVSVVCARMPFPNLCSLVSVLSKHGGPERRFFTVIDAPRVFTFHPHGFDSIGLITCKQGGTGTHAP